MRQGRDAGRQWKRRGAGGDPGSRRAAGPRAFSQAHSLVEPLLTSPGLLGPASTQQASGRAELQSEGTPPLPRSVPAIRGAGRDLPASPNTLTTIAERFSHHNTQDRQEWGKQVWLLGAGLRVQDVLAQMVQTLKGVCPPDQGSRRHVWLPAWLPPRPQRCPGRQLVSQSQLQILVKAVVGHPAGLQEAFHLRPGQMFSRPSTGTTDQRPLPHSRPRAG